MHGAARRQPRRAASLAPMSIFFICSMASNTRLANDGVPIAIRFDLVGGGHVEGERLTVRKRGSAVEPQARNPNTVNGTASTLPCLPDGWSAPRDGNAVWPPLSLLKPTRNATNEVKLSPKR